MQALVLFTCMSDDGISSPSTIGSIKTDYTTVYIATENFVGAAPISLHTLVLARRQGEVFCSQKELAGCEEIKHSHTSSLTSPSLTIKKLTFLGISGQLVALLSSSLDISLAWRHGWGISVEVLLLCLLCLTEYLSPIPI